MDVQNAYCNDERGSSGDDLRRNLRQWTVLDGHDLQLRAERQFEWKSLEREKNFGRQFRVSTQPKTKARFLILNTLIEIL